MPSTKARKWVFTLNKEGLSVENYVQNIRDLAEKFQYVGGQLERAPATGRLHIQGVLYLKNARTLAGLKKDIPTAHLEQMKGTWDEAVAYSKKPETREADFFSVGEEPRQGKRSDIEGLIEDLKNPQKKLKTVAEDNPGPMLRYFNNALKMRALFSSKRDFMTELIVYWGPTGSGKSTRLRTLWPDAFYLHPSMITTSSIWWDGYEGEETIAIEEFHANLPIRLLLVLLDQSPLQLQIKGGTVTCLAKRVVITSNVDPQTWYAASTSSVPHTVLQSLRRRFYPPHGTVMFMGYGDNMDQAYCRCANADRATCTFFHEEQDVRDEGHAAYAAGLLH